MDTARSSRLSALALVGGSLLLAAPLWASSAPTRLVGETEVGALLADALQQNQAGPSGELELKFTRPWPALNTSGGPVRLKVTERPATGINPHFVVRFELRAEAGNLLGSWQMPVAAKLWRSVWVARTALVPGTSLAAADLVQERRDALTVREPCWEGAVPDAEKELATYLPAGTVLYARAVRARPVVQRGQLLEARVLQGALLISLQVEALEAGAPGQVIRVRNPRSQKELRGKVQDEHTIVVVL